MFSAPLWFNLLSAEWRSSHRQAATLVFSLCLSVLPAELRADDVLSPEQSVETVKEILGQGRVVSRHPWYDAETDGERRIHVPVQVASQPWSFNLTFLEFLYYLGWGVLIAAILTILFFLVRAWIMRDRGATSTLVAAGDGNRLNQADKVEELPFRLNRNTNDLLGEARRCYEAGLYDEAIIYFYSHQLLELDKNHFIRLTRGKTNRQYLRELRERLQLKDLLQQTMVAFEDVFFGAHPLAKDRFEACWFQLDRFNAMTRQGALV